MKNLLENGKWYDVATEKGTFLGRYDGHSTITDTLIFTQLSGNRMFVKENAVLNVDRA